MSNNFYANPLIKSYILIKINNKIIEILIVQYNSTFREKGN